jgi:hypothetical protein
MPAELALEHEYNFVVTDLRLAGLGCRRLATSGLGDPSLHILRRGNTCNEAQGNLLLDQDYLCRTHHGNIGRNGVCSLRSVYEGACATRLPELFLQHPGVGKADWCSRLAGARNSKAQGVGVCGIHYYGGERSLLALLVGKRPSGSGAVDYAGCTGHLVLYAARYAQTARLSDTLTEFPF